MAKANLKIYASQLLLKSMAVWAPRLCSQSL